MAASDEKRVRARELLPEQLAALAHSAVDADHVSRNGHRATFDARYSRRGCVGTRSVLRGLEPRGFPQPGGLRRLRELHILPSVAVRRDPLG